MFFLFQSQLCLGSVLGYPWMSQRVACYFGGHYPSMYVVANDHCVYSRQKLTKGSVSIPSTRSDSTFITYGAKEEPK